MKQQELKAFTEKLEKEFLELYDEYLHPYEVTPEVQIQIINDIEQGIEIESKYILDESDEIKNNGSMKI